jgi:hypothetical protein
VYRLIHIFLLLSFSTCIYGYDIDVSPILKLAEKKILKEMKDSKKTELDYFETYIKGADEAVRFGRTVEALYFYDKSLGYNVKKDKLFVYSQMMALSYFSGDEKLAKEISPDYQKEFSKKKRDIEEQSEYYMYKVLLTDKLHTEALNKKELEVLRQDDRSLEAIRRHDIKIFFQRKSFEEIYGLYHGEKIKRARIDEQIIYDLTVVLLKKKKQELLCRKLYYRYPNARDTSYSMIICGMLLDVKDGKKPKKESLAQLEKILEKYPSKKFLASVAKNLY